MGVRFACRDLAEAIEQGGLAPLPSEARAHLADCAECLGLVADFQSIIAAAHELPAEVAPPARVWLSLRAQLAAEGLIREEVLTHEAVYRPHWWQGFSDLIRSRALATAAVGLLIFAAAVVQLRHTPPATSTVAEPDALTASGVALTNQEHELRAVQPAGTLSSPSPVDDSLQKDLQTLDAFIADCEHHLKSNPHDQLAREYLAGALQQKAELLAEMMDRGRSVN